MRPETHTPAPWRYEAGTKTIRAVPSNYWLASMDSWDGAVNHEANAKLIAAAPELLAALKALYNECSGRPRANMLKIILPQVREAISKAEGQPNG